MLGTQSLTFFAVGHCSLLGAFTRRRNHGEKQIQIKKKYIYIYIKINKLLFIHILLYKAYNKCAIICSYSQPVPVIDIQVSGTCKEKQINYINKCEKNCQKRKIECKYLNSPKSKNLTR